MKKETKRKMKAAAVAGMLGVATLFGAGGCENTVTEYKYRDVPVEDTGEDKSVKYDNFEGIEIYKDAGVTYQQASAFFWNLIRGYNLLSASDQNTIKDKIKEIHVVPYTDGISVGNCVENGAGQYVVEFSSNFDESNIGGQFSVWIVKGVISQAHQKDVIRLANQFDNSKETVRLATEKVRNQVHASVPDTKFS